MAIPGWIARPVTDKDRSTIANATLWHLTKPKYADLIRQGTAPGSNKDLVELKASQGWSLNPTKLIRDWSILDKNFDAKDYARYLYFFMNKPAFLERKFLEFQGITSSIQVDGKDLLKACNSRIFFRQTDSVVVIRGDYRGPGIFTV